jgi:hypothetical protein
MRTQRFAATEEHGIWTVHQGVLPIGRALTKRDADCFVEALNGVLGDDLRDRVLSAVTDAIEECFDAVDT